MTGTNLGQRKHNEPRACALLVPNVRMALVWRSSGVYIHTWKTLTFLSMQKMCTGVDAHKNEWRSSGVLVKSSKNSDARPANHNALTKILQFCALDVRDWAFTRKRGQNDGHTSLMLHLSCAVKLAVHLYNHFLNSFFNLLITMISTSQVYTSSMCVIRLDENIHITYSVIKHWEPAGAVVPLRAVKRFS